MGGEFQGTEFCCLLYFLLCSTRSRRDSSAVVVEVVVVEEERVVLRRGPILYPFGRVEYCCIGVPFTPELHQQFGAHLVARFTAAWQG
jgi:hypothetical protein